MLKIRVVESIEKIKKEISLIIKRRPELARIGDFTEDYKRLIDLKQMIEERTCPLDEKYDCEDCPYERCQFVF